MDIIHIHKNLSTIHGYLPRCIHGSPYNGLGLLLEIGTMTASLWTPIFALESCQAQAVMDTLQTPGPTLSMPMALVHWQNGWMTMCFCKFSVSSLICTYNEWQCEVARKIEEHRGQVQSGGRIWFNAGTLEDGRDEHVEDAQFSLHDLSGCSECNMDDEKYCYAFTDIDDISGKLGIPWQAEKDIPFHWFHLEPSEAHHVNS